MKPDVAFYYPGQYWRDPDWVKNLICFFDGIAMLIPAHMQDYNTFDDYPIVSALKDHGLFHVIRPEEAIDGEATKVLVEALGEIIDSGRLDHLTKRNSKDAKRSAFGSLSMSRLGFYGDRNLADSILQELKSRGLAEDSKDGVTIPIHATVRSLILVLLVQILKSKGEDLGLTLSPATDRELLVNALSEIISEPVSSSLTYGDVVSFDMDRVGVDLGKIPVDEILDFRQQNYSQHRDYILSAREFARELSKMQQDEREAKFEQRQEELKDLSQELKKIYRGSWKQSTSFGITLVGAAWTMYSGDPIGAAISSIGALTGILPEKPNEVDVYSYLFSAKERFL